MTKRATKQNARVSITIDGVSWGVFDTRTGGEVTAAITKRRPGGMGRENTWAGLPTTSDITFTRDYDLDRDHPKYLDLVKRRRIGQARVQCSDQPLDEFGQPYGDPVTYAGRLQGMTPPEKDSTSSDPSMLSMTMVVETS